MDEIEARIRALWERLARENRHLPALLRAGHTLAGADELLEGESALDEPEGKETEEQ